MSRLAFITGFAVLLFAVSDARAGLMTPDALTGEAGMSADAAGQAAPAGQNDHDQVPGHEQLERLAQQPAQGSSGATGSSTSVTHGFSPVAALMFVSLTAAAEPSGYCVEFANSQLPQPPTSDLLRPPRHSA